MKARHALQRAAKHIEHLLSCGDAGAVFTEEEKRQILVVAGRLSRLKTLAVQRLAAQNKSVTEIAQLLQLSRPAVEKIIHTKLKNEAAVKIRGLAPDALIQTIPSPSLLNLTLEELELSLRARVALSDGGIKTVADMSGKTFNDLLKLPNLGRKSLEEILEALKNHQLRD